MTVRDRKLFGDHVLKYLQKIRRHMLIVMLSGILATKLHRIL